MSEADLFDIPTPPCARLLGWRLIDHDAAKGWIQIGFEGKAEFLNPAGFIQGGIQAAMLDDTLGPAVWIATQGRLYTATIDMNVSFLAPAKPGMLIGEGQVIQLGKTVGFLEGRLRDMDGNILARATASARLVARERAVPQAQSHPVGNL